MFFLSSGSYLENLGFLTQIVFFLKRKTFIPYMYIHLFIYFIFFHQKFAVLSQTFGIILLINFQLLLRLFIVHLQIYFSKTYFSSFSL